MNVERKTDQPELFPRKNINCMGGCDNWGEFWRGIDHAGKACPRSDGVAGVDRHEGEDRATGEQAGRFQSVTISSAGDGQEGGKNRRKKFARRVVIWLCQRRLMMPILSSMIIIFTVALAQAGVL